MHLQMDQAALLLEVEHQNYNPLNLEIQLCSCPHLWKTWKSSASNYSSPLASENLFDLQSLAAAVLFFSLCSSLCSPCLSSLNLSSSCCSFASPVLCSAVLITMPFSCQETKYDDDTRRGSEHLQTGVWGGRGEQTSHWGG